jgi:hypothetical protein
MEDTMTDKKVFDMMVWYNAEEYGKAWTTIEAASEEEARAKLTEIFDNNDQYELEWEYHAKGGDGAYFDPEIEVRCIERKDNDES